MTSLVSIYNAGQANAPTLSGTAGSLVAVLDAVLVNGWGVQTAASLVVSGGIATLNLPSTPAMTVDGLVTVAGASPGALNGPKKVLTVVGNLVTFDATGIAPGTATGTITAKVSPLGWTKLFSATNVAAYQSANPEATTCVLRVDDTGTTTARVRGYEEMTSISAGSGPFPTDGQISGGLYWGKSITADATVRPWYIVGDDRMFYLMVGTPDTVSSQTRGGTAHMFGDILPLTTADNRFSCVLGGGDTSGIVSTGSVSGGDFTQFNVWNQGSGFSFKYFPRNYAQVGTSVAAATGSALAFGGSATSGASLLPFPNAANDGLLLTNIFCFENNSVRGDLPGVLACMQNVLSSGYASGFRVDAHGPLQGRALRFYRAGGPVTAVGSFAAACFFDVTGPWR